MITPQRSWIETFTKLDIPAAIKNEDIFWKNYSKVKTTNSTLSGYAKR
jgi:hypothetical protein